MVVGTTKRRQVAIGPRPTSRAKNLFSSKSSPVIAEGDAHPVGKSKASICRCSKWLKACSMPRSNGSVAQSVKALRWWPHATPIFPGLVNRTLDEFMKGLKHG